MPRELILVAAAPATAMRPTLPDTRLSHNHDRSETVPTPSNIKPILNFVQTTPHDTQPTSFLPFFMPT